MKKTNKLKVELEKNEKMMYTLHGIRRNKRYKIGTRALFV